MKAGAGLVKLEAVVRATTRARVPELAQAKKLPDKLLALWKARNDLPDEARQNRLFEKVEQLESEGT